MTTKLTTFEEEKLREYEKNFTYANFTWNGDNATGKKFAQQQKAKFKKLLLSSLHQQREMIRKGVDNKIAELLRSFANTPVKDRKNAFDYLVECGPKILALLSNKEI